MSIFSRVKKSAQSAKKHNAKLAEQKKKEEEDAAVTPYRHVPTHAASDLLSSAPRSWIEADRPQIVEENRRRSAAAISINKNRLSIPGTPRMSSSLSYVAFPPDDTVSPVMPMLPRSYSYTASPARGQETMYQVPQMAHSQPYSLKGKQAVRWPIYETPDPGFDFGPASSENSSGSSAYGDNLDVGSGTGDCQSVGTATTAETTQAPTFKRSRRQSDPAADRRPGPIAGIRDARPPPSTRGFRSIPASAAPSPLQPGQLPGHLPLDSSSPSAISPEQLSPTLAPSPSSSSERPSWSADKKAARLQALNRLVSGDMPSPPSLAHAKGASPTASRPAPNAPVDPSPLATEVDPFSVIGVAVTDVDHLTNNEVRGGEEAIQSSSAALAARSKAPETETHSPSAGRAAVEPQVKPAQVVNAFPTPISSPTHDQKSGFFGKGSRKLFKKVKA